MKILMILHIALITCLLSCDNQPKEECVHDSFLFEYTKGDFESDIPPVNWGYLFFAEINNDSIIITNNFYLYQIFNKNYLQQFSNFHMFLCSLYENDIILQKEYIDETILRNNILFKKEISFENRNLSELKEHYFNDSHYLKTKINLTEDEIYSLLYFFLRVNIMSFMTIIPGHFP